MFWPKDIRVRQLVKGAQQWLFLHSKWKLYDFYKQCIWWKQAGELNKTDFFLKLLLLFFLMLNKDVLVVFFYEEICWDSTHLTVQASAAGTWQGLLVFILSSRQCRFLGFFFLFLSHGILLPRPSALPLSVVLWELPCVDKWTVNKAVYGNSQCCNCLRSYLLYLTG